MKCVQDFYGRLWWVPSIRLAVVDNRTVQESESVTEFRDGAVDVALGIGASPPTLKTPALCFDPF